MVAQLAVAQLGKPRVAGVQRQGDEPGAIVPGGGGGLCGRGTLIITEPVELSLLSDKYGALIGVGEQIRLKLCVEFRDAFVNGGRRCLSAASSAAPASW